MNEYRIDAVIFNRDTRERIFCDTWEDVYNAVIGEGYTPDEAEEGADWCVGSLPGERYEIGRLCFDIDGDF